MSRVFIPLGTLKTSGARFLEFPTLFFG
jgi:hypothetical protein